MRAIFFFLALLTLNNCVQSSEVWCFQGKLRETLCFDSKNECETDWHKTWDADIAAHIFHPLACRKF
jgi:hypothetical protein